MSFSDRQILQETNPYYSPLFYTFLQHPNTVCVNVTHKISKLGVRMYPMEPKQCSGKMVHRLIYGHGGILYKCFIKPTYIKEPGKLYELLNDIT